MYILIYYNGNESKHYRHGNRRKVTDFIQAMKKAGKIDHYELFKSRRIR